MSFIAHVYIELIKYIEIKAILRIILDFNMLKLNFL